jgi:hypothetical protein
LFSLQSLEMIDVLPDDVLFEILAFYANKTKHDHARVPKVVKHGVRIAWTHGFSAQPKCPEGGAGARCFASDAYCYDAAPGVKAEPRL